MDFGGVIGAVAGQSIPFSLAGVDFALTALFMVLLIEQLAKSRDATPPVIGALAAFAAVVLSRCGLFPSGHILIAAIAFALAVLVAVRGKKFKTETETSL